MYVSIDRKLSELYFNKYLLSNPGNKVLIFFESMRAIYHIDVLVIITLSFGLENNNILKYLLKQTFNMADTQHG